DGRDDSTGDQDELGSPTHRKASVTDLVPIIFPSLMHPRISPTHDATLARVDHASISAPLRGLLRWRAGTFLHTRTRWIARTATGWGAGVLEHGSATVQRLARPRAVRLRRCP